MIDLSLSENQNTNQNWLKTILKSFDVGKISTYNMDGKLRHEISKAHNISKDKIFETYGAEASLDRVFHQISLLCKKYNYTLILPEIFWEFYAKLANFHEIPIKLFKLRKENEDFSFDIDTIKVEIDRFEKAIFLLNLPLNPLGINISFEQTLEIHDNLKPNQLLIIDQSYYGFTEEKLDYCAHIERLKKGLVIRTFSKFFGLASLRVGYFVCGEEWLDVFSFRREYLGINSISSHIACECLNNEELFYSMSREVEKERNDLFNFFKSLPNCYPYKSEANFLLVKMNSPLIYHDFLLENGIKVRHLVNEILHSHIRIGIGTAEQMEKLKETTLSFVNSSCNFDL